MQPKSAQNVHLALHTEGKRHFITIASDKAKKLRTYLQDKGIQTRQPEPMTPGVDTIELLPGQKVDKVQLFLSGWDHKPTAEAS